MFRTIQTADGETLDLRPLIDLLGPKEFIDRFIAAVGAKRIVAEIGLAKIIDTMGMDWFVSLLRSRYTPEQLQELKRRLP